LKNPLDPLVLHYTETIHATTFTFACVYNVLIVWTSYWCVCVPSSLLPLFINGPLFNRKYFIAG